MTSRPALTAQSTGLNRAMSRIHGVTRFSCRKALERNVSGRTRLLEGAMRVPRWRAIRASPFDNAATASEIRTDLESLLKIGRDAGLPDRIIAFTGDLLGLCIGAY